MSSPSTRTRTVPSPTADNHSNPYDQRTPEHSGQLEEESLYNGLKTPSSKTKKTPLVLHRVDPLAILSRSAPPTQRTSMLLPRDNSVFGTLSGVTSRGQASKTLSDPFALSDTPSASKFTLAVPRPNIVRRLFATSTASEHGTTPGAVDTIMTSPEKTLLGKHPASPSPDGSRARSKGIKLPSARKEFSLPRTPDFSQSDNDEREDLSMRPFPRFDLSSVALKRKSLGSTQELYNSPFDSTRTRDLKDNPFTTAFLPTRVQSQDYLGSSQWYALYPHIISKDYLDKLFRNDSIVMFDKPDGGDSLDVYPDYLQKHFETDIVLLGNGEFSDVLNAKERSTGKSFAIKRLRKTVQGAMERKGYLTEVRNLWSLRACPYVVQLEQAWEQSGRIYIQLEFCQGGNLHSIMKDHVEMGGLDEDTIWKFFGDLTLGLRFIHFHNIVHLDIKPANIFVSDPFSKDNLPTLKIGDFGHSCTIPVNDSDGREGDRYYMAQELLNDQCDTFSDIFSLGMCIYEMAGNLLGLLPGEGPEWHVLRDGQLNFAQLFSEGCELRKKLHEELLTQRILVKPTQSISSPVPTTPVGRNFGNGDDYIVKDLMSTPKHQPQQQSRPSSSSSSSQQQEQQQSSSPSSPLPIQRSDELLQLLEKLMQPDYKGRPSAEEIVMMAPKIKERVSKTEMAKWKRQYRPGQKPSEDAISFLLNRK